MVDYRSDPGVARYQSWTPEWSMSDAEEFLKTDRATALGTRGSWTQLALEERASGEWTTGCVYAVLAREWAVLPPE